MRKILLLCGLAMFLSSGVAYTAKAPDAGVVVQDYPSTPEGRAKRYEDDAKKCEQEAYDLNREMQEMRALVVETNGEPMFVWRLITLKEEYRSACFWYHVWVKHAGWERADIPTPTPTPTPTPASPNPGDPQRKPTPSSGTGEMPGWPRDDTNDAHIRFIKEQERKLRELRDEKNKLFKEINDYIKTAKPRPPKPGFKVGFDSTSGLFIVNFTTPQGVVRVYLPNDMRSGDTISGSVVTEPNGQTEEERARNRKALNGYQLMIANQKAEELGRKNQPRPTFGGPFGSSPDEAIWTFRALWDPGPCTLSVVEVASGKEMARATIPLSTTESKATRPQTPTPNDFNLPTIGQNGSSVEIKGPFDGNLRTTEITVGNQPVIKRTETPRGCTFQSPEQSVGSADITLKENNVEAKGTYRNLGVRLNAPKTSLLKGETTPVTIDVSGLQGIKEDMPLHLETRGVINMAGGNYQYLQIRPQDVKPDGRYTTTRAITGQQAGAFGVTATVVDSARRPITDAPRYITLTAGAVTNGYKVIQGGDGAFFVNINGAENPKTKKKLEGLFDLEYWCGPASSPVRVSMSFFGGSSAAPVKIECGKGAEFYAPVNVRLGIKFQF